MLTIEKRAEQPHTVAFVTFMTVDVLARKMIGIIGNRRMTKVRRYLGDSAGTTDVMAGLYLDHRGFSDAITHCLARSVGVHLTRRGGAIEGFGFSLDRDDETEAEVRERYHHPEKHWMGRREEITLVELDGWPGSPQRTDRIRIETWNKHGVGQEVIIVFDDLDVLEEIAWDIKGDIVREVCMWDEFCTVHNLHYEHHLHERSGACEGRPPTRGETLAALAANALKAEAEEAAKQVD